MFRDTNGHVHALDAFCPHLGANLAVGGKVRGSCLECPFHAWRFNGDDGKCVNIPGAKKSKESMAQDTVVAYTFHCVRDTPIILLRITPITCVQAITIKHDVLSKVSRCVW